MPRLQLNKSTLAHETKNLKTYQRFLPSLDLKRQKLMAERVNATKIILQTKQQIEDTKTNVGKNIPMLANQDIDLTDLVKITQVFISTENLLGTRLPYLQSINIQVQPYALLAKPHWVDNVTSMLQDMLKLQINLQVSERRLDLLNEAVRKVNQRVNLFEKILIPKTNTNIKKIKIYLSDEQMTAVFRSKTSKKKHAVANSL